MAQTWRYLIFITIFANLQVVFSFQCPDGCECLPKRVMCSNNNMTSIPTNASMQEITVFNISSNQIQTLEEKVFFQINLVNVEIIDLSYNLISDIHPNAFFGMKMVKELYLQGNKLTNILPDIFSPLKQLTILDLRNNNIESFNNKTFGSLTLLKNLGLSGLKNFNKDIFDPLKNLEQLEILFISTDVKSEGNNSSQEPCSKAKDWGKDNNITIYVACKVIGDLQRRSFWNLVKSHSNVETLTSGAFIIGIVITVGVLLLLITSLVILAVIVRQSKIMPEDLDDYSYMSDFEPYRGHLSPTKCREFYWPTSRDSYSKCTQEAKVTSKEDLVSNGFPDTVKVDLSQNHQVSSKNYS